MGDRRHSSSAYLYIQHPLPIHSVDRQTKQRASLVEQPPAGLNLWTPPYSPFVHSPAHALHAPPYLLLHPFLQLARIDELQPAASHTPLPAVIVSPHSLSPPPQRDSARLLPKKQPAKSAPAPKDTADGNKESQCSVQSSAPTMTSNGAPATNMASKREEAGAVARAQRPSIVSHHSNSVPSTPLQVARRYDTHSRSPSPNGGLGSHSPRSVASEANSTMPTLRPARPVKCKFETNVGSLGRRRMPYHSSDILEKAKDEPKKTLDPHEDDKLSGDMRELYDRIQPTQENTAVRNKFVAKVQRILETEFPGNEFKVSIFGSSGNMLWTAESDVDICIQTPMKRLEEMHMLAEALDKHGMERVVCIPAAKVRIVKVWDPELQLSCDMNVNNVAALENTRMINLYVQIDDRVRPLAMIVKHWTKRRILNDAGIGGTISSYTWICMILNFLQTRDPPILPSLHKLPDRKIDQDTGKPSLSSFADDLEALRGFGKSNAESLGQLLFHFFRLYGHEVDYEKIVVSVRQGCRIQREEKNWHPGGGQKEGVNRLCVEEPFSTDRNLGNSADDYAWRGIHLEIRRAFDLLADSQQLEKACEQYEFPAQEQSSSIFKKPQSQKATITSSVPTRNGRGGSNHRGGRGGFNSRNQNNNGRRSSGSNSYLQGRPPFLHSPPISAGPGQEYFAFSRGMHDQLQLHDHLAQQYQLLEMQSNNLRAHLAAQQHAQQSQQVRAAQMHAHAIAQAQAQNRGSSNVSSSPQKTQYVNGNSSPRLGEVQVPSNSLPQGFLYHYPGFYNPAQSQDAGSQDGTRTNPSSPSLSNSIPGLRRQVHRPSNASDTASLRSHSQPPRAVAPQPIPAGYQAVPQYFDPATATFAGYPIARSTPQDIHVPQSASDVQYSPLSSHPEPVMPEVTAPPLETAPPKEYPGYYVVEQPQPRQLQDYVVGPIPSFSELAQRRRRVSPEITQPLLNTALRRVSRSPSPLGGHMRSYSTGVHDPNVAVNDQRKARVDSVRPPVDSGPVIVNGSFPTPPREPRIRSDTIESLPPDLSKTNGLGIFSNQQAMHQINEIQARQQMVLEEMQRHKIAAADSMGPPIVNGSTRSSPSAESNGLTRVPSEGQQSFPPLPEGWMAYEASNGQKNSHNEEISPKRTLPPQWRTPAYTNGLPSLDTSNPARMPPQEVKSATLPLLSPVFETRTPSPSASRPNDAGKLINGVKAQAKDTSQQNRRASHTPPSNASKENRNGQQKGKAQQQGTENGSKSAGTNHNGSWQQQPIRNARNSKKNKKKSAEQKNTGEPLPANAADRKGG
ncbi:hypothetical protein HBH56_120710 [Parastagonospora nodorum]|uniref:polynucleotide adenylyltransferase n=1 Tax=Phaeosphaeria nodorum (strain SN15 / ATCC MYA-4574 / FGSC 10173) TaxID=321614 RepID=A0A7U2I6V6_PHANO|nr:hypothetical protein HBH56_120710 [Parastagonospora nodorum]QRD03949.1 hypothetical protein JI435_138070 [Parastagonospora nodorum SN15]KAH3924262.1 hypothetical protein HBH54_196610 [Parastagonospora nodorum]KAH3942567.1 hypothetical protein HBH53_186890 [Parastagonospora nodorum]KAH3961551.1 hypothetical protein HBH51_182070 [Parastagonospora nodorum]